MKTPAASTAGPWSFALVDDPHTKPLRGFQIRADAVVIAEIFARPYQVAVLEENARLIACAPDMLSALRAARPALLDAGALVALASVDLAILRATNEPAGRVDKPSEAASFCMGPQPATTAEIAAAREVWHSSTIEIDDDANASHADDHTWVSAWVLVKNERIADDHQPDDFADDDVDPIARKARIL